MTKWTRETSIYQTAVVAGCKVSVKRWWSGRERKWLATAFVYPPGDKSPWSHGYDTVYEAKRAAVRLAELLGGKTNG